MFAWKQKKLCLWVLGSLSSLSLLIMPAIAWAAQSQSPNYQVNEVFFGAGGELNSCSGNYCSKQSVGELAVGHSASANYQAQAGFNTDRFSYIECIVNSTNINLGTISPNSTKTATATFAVKAYLAHGYSVVNASDPPTNGSYTMQSINVPSASSPGTEQFGINLVANTDPINFGANPSQSPDATFGYGQVAADYSTPNMYKYLKNDAIAGSTASSSNTNYTISYVLNISNITPGGAYSMHHVLVATGTY